jgi:uncharacterized protein with HEPN domain
MEIMNEDIIRLTDMADSIREIQGYIGRSDYDNYAGDEFLREEVIVQLAQIGGAAAMLTDEFKEKYGEVDWDMLKGLQYANFDETLEMDVHPIWHIVKEDLPEIMNQILDLAATLQDEEDLKDVTLNDEDLRDVQELHAKKELEVPEKEDINMEDDAEPSNASDDTIVEYVPDINEFVENHEKDKDKK